MQNLTKFTQTAAGNISTPKNLAVGGTMTVTGATSLGAAVLPVTTDGGALGSATKMWSDLFLASGAVVNFNNGNVTVTHAAGALTVSAATLAHVGARTNGTFVSAASGSGNVMSSSVTAVERVYADDGGVALTTGSLRVSLARFLVDTAVSGGSFSLRGQMGQIKVDASVETSGTVAGVEGYVECTASAVLNGRFTGVRSMVDVPTSAVISSGKYASAFLAESLTLGGTHTGKAVVLDVSVPGAGVWDAMIHVDASTGTTAAGTTKSTPGGVDNWVKIIVDGTVNYIPCYTSTTA